MWKKCSYIKVKRLKLRWFYSSSGTIHFIISLFIYYQWLLAYGIHTGLFIPDCSGTNLLNLAPALFLYLKDSVSYHSGRTQTPIIYFSSMINFQTVGTSVKENGCHPYVMIHTSWSIFEWLVLLCYEKDTTHASPPNSSPWLVKTQLVSL